MANRDGQNGSQLIRIWIERYVRVKDPSNPQRPLEQFDPTFVDYHEAQRDIILNYLFERSKNDKFMVRWSDILDQYKDLPIVKTRLKRAEEMAKALKLKGCIILRRG